MYIWWLLKCLGVFFLWKAYQTLWSCQNFPPGQQSLASINKAYQTLWSCEIFPPDQQSLASINNKNPAILTKRTPVATTVPSGTQRHQWGIGIRGHTFGSLIQARAIPTPSWGSALPVTIESPMGVPIQLYRKGAYIHYLWLYSENTAKKDVLFDGN